MKRRNRELLLLAIKWAEEMYGRSEHGDWGLSVWVGNRRFWYNGTEWEEDNLVSSHLDTTPAKWVE